MQKPLKVTILLTLVFGLSLLASGCPSPGSIELAGTTLPRFQSEEDFIEAFRDAQPGYRYLDAANSIQMEGLSESTQDAWKGSEHSTTNIQVAGVDEADTVKSDGEYIYTIAGNSVCIVKAYPPDDMRIASRIEFDGDAGLSEMFVNGNKLVIIGYSYMPEQAGQNAEEAVKYSPGTQLSFLRIYDISDRDSPRLLKTIEHEGFCLTSRMIDENIYVILTSWPSYAIYEDTELRPEEIVPLYRSVQGDDEPGAFEPVCDWSEVEYIEREMCSSFLSILSLSLADGGSSIEKREIAGNASCVYASPDNLYVTSSDYGRYLLEEDTIDSDETLQTTIHKFSFDGAAVSYLASAEVPGTVLNQFSMDEWNGYFRIATTGYGSGGSFETSNNVFALDPALNISGRLEGLAPGETIYSARFLGNRGYLVTFEQIDPFFVLDLSNPSAPRVLGELKIPGYSNYLHPYDETHVIGIGKNAVSADPSEGNWSWHEGMKIALFDVTDVSNPREMYKVDIGDRGTDSYALHDHKAFLFDRDKELLVLPVLLAEFTPEQIAAGAAQAPSYGRVTFQGAYVCNISLAGGFDLRGRITHISDPSELAAEEYYYYYESDKCISRSLYIGDSLYTISDYGIKANDLGALEEQALITLEP